MAIMKEYRKQPTGLDKQEWQGYTSTSGQRLPSVSRRQLYGQQCIHTSGETISSVYGYHSLPSICSITIFIETFSPPSMYFECVYAYKTGSQSEVNSFFGWTDFTIYSSCLLFCSISYFLQSTYIIYTKKNAPPKKKLRASADRHGKKKQTNMVLLAMAKNSSFCIKESCRKKWTQTHTLTRTGCGGWRWDGDGGGGRACGVWGGMETSSRKRRSGLQDSSEEPHPITSTHSGSRLNMLSYHIMVLFLSYHFGKRAHSSSMWGSTALLSSAGGLLSQTHTYQISSPRRSSLPGRPSAEIAFCWSEDTPSLGHFCPAASGHSQYPPTSSLLCQGHRKTTILHCAWQMALYGANSATSQDKSGFLKSPTNRDA